jgi:hypothetical protein
MHRIFGARGGRIHVLGCTANGVASRNREKCRDQRNRNHLLSHYRSSIEHPER